MPRHKPHNTRSRYGCAQCKQRHGKCDEQKPICVSCQIHRTSCSFAFQASRPPGALLRRRQEDYSLQRQSSSYSVPSPLHALSASQPMPPSWTMEDMGLLHHFSLHTCYTIVEKNRLTGWDPGEGMPRLALADPHLMQTLLAIAALHKGHLVNSPIERRRYIALAQAHQNSALRAFTPRLSNITKENFQAVLLFVGLFAVYNFAIQHCLTNLESDDLCQVEITDTWHWIKCTRGVDTILHWGRGEGVQGLGNGPLRGMWDGDPPGAPIPPAIKKKTQWLREKLLQTDRVPDYTERRSYSSSIDILEQCTANLIYSATPHFLGNPAYEFLGFLATLNDEHYRALLRKRPGALVILGFSSQLVSHLEHLWWAKGWSHAIFKFALSHLPEDWKALLTGFNEEGLV